MNYLASFPPKTIYRAMTKRSNYFRQSFNPEYSKVYFEADIGIIPLKGETDICRMGHGDCRKIEDF